MRPLLIALLTVFCGLTFIASGADAQRRDFFTEEEVELVRDAQEIDLRIAVLVHSMDRRFGVLKVDVGTPVKEQKEREEWGPLPKGSRIELLSDIKSIMQKAIDDINNLAARPDSAIVVDADQKQPKGFKELFPKAVRTLAAAAARYRPVLNNELSKTEDRSEKGIFMDLIEDCDEITEAVGKLPAEVKKSKN